MKTIEFTIPQEPQQKKSPLLTSRGGHAMAIPDKRNTVNYQTIQAYARAAGWVGEETHYGPVKLLVDAQFSEVASWTKKRTEEMRELDSAHISRPDADRLANLVMDALGKGFMWKDDSQIFYLAVQKTYAVGTPCTKVKIILIPATHHSLKKPKGENNG